MKKLLCLVFSCFLLLSLSACGGGGEKPTQPPTAATEAPTTQATQPPRPTGPEALDGKKIIFIGNSYTFYGHTVIFKQSHVLTQEERSNDQGYFYQLCKQNGIDVEVTNWTFGGHNITDFFGAECQKADAACCGERHEYFIKDRYFDYVVVQPYSEKGYSSNLVKYLENLTAFFREANPNVQFILHIPHMAVERNYKWVKDVDELKAEGFLVADWGTMLHDISEGNVTVPGATLSYDRNSFVITKDDHHENALAGYLTTLMVYCAITGEDPVGQPYEFCYDSAINSRFDLEAYRATYYPDVTVTNFVEAFHSPADMQGLQELAKQYLAQ